MSNRMIEATASAPGKIMLAGEYAVIDGADAVMMAVDRRAVANLVAEPAPLSPFLEEAARLLADELGYDAGALARRIVVDTSALHSGAFKLGLGSSAAATVSAVGCAVVAAGRPLDRRLIHRLAHTAHRAAQSRRGAPGSGADVAASVWGGMSIVRTRDPAGDQPLEVMPIPLPPELILVPVWTGQPADTAELVDRVRELRTDDRVAYDRAAQGIADAVAELVAAFHDRSACRAVGALAAGGQAVGALGRAAGVTLESEVHRKLRRMAERRGGALKPTGAGAGDLALAAFDKPPAAEQFRSDATRAGMICPPLAVDPEGVTALVTPSPAD